MPTDKKEISTLAEKLAFSTVRISSTFPDKPPENGTGFMFSFLFGEHEFRSIATNKHVLAGANQVSFALHESHIDEQGKRSVFSHGKIFLNINCNADEILLGHPDKGVDLCVFPFSLIEQGLKKHDASPFYCALKEHNIPSKDELASLNIVEDVLMVGYPVALWDSMHGQPIFRKGSTATDPATEFDGKAEFLIDIACWPGSSGSPVCIADHGGFVARDGSRVDSNRSMLLGVLYAGPFFQPLPGVTELRQFINIGKVLRSSLLLDIKPVIAKEHPPPKDGVVPPSSLRLDMKMDPT